MPTGVFEISDYHTSGVWPEALPLWSDFLSLLRGKFASFDWFLKPWFLWCFFLDVIFPSELLPRIGFYCLIVVWGSPSLGSQPV